MSVEDKVMADTTGQEEGRKAPNRRQHGLGRGLSALLGDSMKEEPVAGSSAPDGQSSERLKSVQLVDISRISPHPDQPQIGRAHV